MADNVVISQIQWSSDLPKWATEETQRTIAQKLGALEKINKESKDQDKKASEKEQKQNKDTTTILEKGFKSMKEAAKNQTQAFNKFSAEKLIPKTPFKAFNQGITKVAGKLGFLGAAFGAFGFVIGGIVGKFKSFSDQFRGLFATGFRFEQGSMGLAKAAVRAEMSLGQYSEILERYSTAVGVLGVTSFSNLNVQMRDTLQEFGLLGMNLNELTEYTADYLDQRRLLGILETTDKATLAKNTETYLKNITALTTLLNVSREQISQIVKSSVTVAAFTNALNMAPQQLREQMLQTAQVVTAGFAALGNDYGNQLANAFTTAVGRGGLYFTEVGRELLAVSQPLYHAMSDLANTVDPNNAGAKFSAMLDIMANTTEAERERLMILERSNTQYAQGARNIIGLINQAQQLEAEQIQAIKNMEKFREAQQVDDTTKAFVNFEIAMQKLKTVFDKFFTSLFGNNKVLDLFEKIMKRVSKAAVSFANMILNNAGKIGDAIGNAFEAVITFFEGFKGKSIGGVIMHALSPILLGLKYAIAGAIKMGFNAVMASLPSFLPGDQTPFDDQKTNLDSLTKAKSTTFQYEPGKGRGITFTKDYDLARSIMENKKNLATESIQQLGYGGKTLAELKELPNPFGQDDVDKAIKLKKEELRLQKEIDKLVTKRKEQEELIAKFSAQDIKNREQFLNDYGPEYSYDLSIANDRLTKNPNYVDPLRGNNDIDGNAQLTGTRTPEEITAAKMKIMRQYLPMAGKGDPNQDVTGNYYEQMIAELKILTRLQDDQIKKLESINAGVN